jgi:hypothetical protein
MRETVGSLRAYLIIAGSLAALINLTLLSQSGGNPFVILLALVGLGTFNHGATKDGFIHDAVLHRDGYLIGVTSGIPGNGMILLARPEEKEPFHVNTKLPNCHAVALHPDMKHFVVTSTNRNSNGNGRRLSKDGEYANNSSPLHLFEIA